MISVPAPRVAEVEAALRFLEAQHQQRGSQVVIGLITRAAKRRGWKREPNEDHPAPMRLLLTHTIQPLLERAHALLHETPHDVVLSHEAFHTVVEREKRLPVLRILIVGGARKVSARRRLVPLGCLKEFRGHLVAYTP